MPELRQNFMTKEWVVIATERAKRPDQMVVKREHKPLVSYSPNCPFCPGNENLTPPEILRVHDGNSWKARVVRTNLQPCLPMPSPSASFTDRAGGWAVSASMTSSSKRLITHSRWP